MPNEHPDSDDTLEEDERTYAQSVLGFSGVLLGPHGAVRPMPDHEALAGAIPQWVLLPEHEAETLDACLGFAAHDHPAVRAAAVAAFGALTGRYGRLDRREQVVRAIELGLRDRDTDVRDAASRSADIVWQALGWQVSRPGA